VAEGDAVVGPQLGLEVVTEGAGSDVEHQRRGVDVDDAAEPGQVEDDAAVDGHRGAADPATAGRGRDGDAGFVADGQDGGDLVGGLGPGDAGGQPGDLPVGGPAHGQRPPVPAGLGPDRRVDLDRGTGSPQPLDDRVGHRHLVSLQVGGGVGCPAGDLDGRRRSPWSQLLGLGHELIMAGGCDS
jgi:hypothetical protein